jgi:3-oxoacyl-[acyl-carrier protein] reductase
MSAIYTCCEDNRRTAVALHPTLNGIDYLEVLDLDAPAGSPRQRTLMIRLLKPVPAGLTRDNLLARMKDEEWDEIQATNLRSVFVLSRAVLRGMMKSRAGRIVNISSVVGFMGNAGQSNYCAAKAGLVGFSKSLAREVGSRNITVNCVAPGFIETDMTRALSEEQAQRLVASVPLGRLGKVDDVAQAVAFLCSPQASYITGSTLHVNGGLFMD